MKKVFGVFLPVVAAAFTAYAQAVEDLVVLEEVYVYAQKRSQNQQVVPVAVSAFSGEDLSISGVKDVFELSTIAAGLDVRQGGSTIGTRFRIRSIGTQSGNFGLESAVGLYVDGVYRARQGSMVNNLVDIASVEVLRGPQGTLFGRNTLAGAVLMTTVAPAHNGREGFAQVTAGNYDLLNFSGATSLSAIEDILAFRIAGFSSQRDGYADDVRLGDNKLYDRDRWGARLQALYTPTDALSVRVSADYSEIDEACCAALVTQDNLRPVALPDGATSYAGTDEVVRAAGGSVFTGDRFYDLETAQSIVPVSESEDSGISVTVDWNHGNYSLISITAYRSFDSFSRNDSDASDLDSVNTNSSAEQSAWTQELRITGGEGNYHYVAGLYYFSQDLDNISTVELGQDINLVYSHTYGYFPDTRGQFPLQAVPSFPLPSLPLFYPGSGAVNSMQQDHEAFAVFSQVDYDLTSTLTLTGGLRYTREDKELYGIFTEGTAPDYTDGIIGQPDVVEQFYAIAPQDPVDESLDDEQLTGTLKLSKYVDNNTMIYAAFSTGYKAGGTNTLRINPELDYIFDPESSEAFEVGLKADFPEHALRLNAALHRTLIEDLQVNSASAYGPVLQNVGKADTWGIEVEATWSPTGSLTLTAAYAYTGGEFDDWENDLCWVAAYFHTGQADPGDPGERANTVGCDRSGDDLAVNPDQLVITANQAFKVATGVNGFLLVEYSHTGKTELENHDPFQSVPAYDLLNARLGIEFEEYGALLTVWGRNILDEEYRMPGFTPIGQEGRVVATPLEPATWGVSLRKDF